MVKAFFILRLPKYMAFQLLIELGKSVLLDVVFYSFGCNFSNKLFFMFLKLVDFK